MNRGLWWLLGGAAILLGALAFAAHVERIEAVLAQFGHVPFEDWWNASNAADRLLAGQPVYHPDQLAGAYNGPDYTLNGFAYPPPAAALFIPFRGPTAGLALWHLVNIGLLLTGLAAILRSELGRGAARAFPFVLGGLLVFPPFATGVVWANVNVGLAGLFAWSWAERARWTAAGMGVGALLKVYPGVLVAWRVRTDGWRRAALGFLAGAVGLSLLTMPLVGIGAWRDFATAVANTRPVCLTDVASVVCALQGPLGLDYQSARWIATTAGVVLALLSIGVPNRPWAFTLVLAGTLAAVPDLHFHYWIFGYVTFTAVVSHTVARYLQRTFSAGAEAAPGDGHQSDLSAPRSSGAGQGSFEVE